MIEEKNKFYIIITVDTEASMYKGKPLPLSKMVYGRIGGEFYGITKMMDIADKYGIKLTFFVSALEYLYYGDEIKKVCNEIHKRGHDVQLHIHPAWKYKQKFLWEYDLNKQIEMIREGKEKIYEWIGEYPIAHRAGGFGANLNTIKALQKNNIPLDFSLFSHYRWCKLDFTYFNSIFEVEGIVEVPSTVFSFLKFLNKKIYRNLDINADSLRELIYVIKELEHKKIKVATLLMHSFSFLKVDKKREKFLPDKKVIKKFEKFLNFLKKNPQYQVITAKEFYNLYKAHPHLFQTNDFIPHTGLLMTLERAFENFHKSWKNKIFVISFLLVINLIIFVMLLII